MLIPLQPEVEGQEAVVEITLELERLESIAIETGGLTEEDGVSKHKSLEVVLEVVCAFEDVQRQSGPVHTSVTLAGDPEIIRHAIEIDESGHEVVIIAAGLRVRGLRSFATLGVGVPCAELLEFKKVTTSFRHLALK